MSIPTQIKLSGKVYIKYVDEIPNPAIGDILLLLNNDATSHIIGDYESTRESGYIIAKIFDGYVWQNINISEFCTQRENKFTKKQRAIDSAILCRDIIIESGNVTLNKTYRGHFSLREYEPAVYNRKANRGRR